MSGFQDLADRLAELQDIPSRIAGEVASGITEGLRQQFDASTDPYGQAWKPLRPQTIKRKGGDSRILRREDVLSSETIARPTAGAGIEITSVAYGQFHQNGTQHMVSRKVLPDGDELPEAWQDLIDAAATAAVRKALRA